MKRVFLILFIVFLFPFPLFAISPFDHFQKTDTLFSPIEVKVLTDKTVVSPGQEFKLYISIIVEEGWHIYSLSPFEGSEPLATQIFMEENVFQEQGAWIEPDPVLIQDGAIGKMVKGHRGNVEFARTYSVPGEAEVKQHFINGRLVFRACDNQVCTLPQEFSLHTAIHVSRK